MADHRLRTCSSRPSSRLIALPIICLQASEWKPGFGCVAVDPTYADKINVATPDAVPARIVPWASTAFVSSSGLDHCLQLAGLYGVHERGMVRLGLVGVVDRILLERDVQLFVVGAVTGEKAGVGRA